MNLALGNPQERRSPLPSSGLAEDIPRWAAQLGFQQTGIAHVDLSAYEPHVRAWLAKGFNGEMGYMERNLDKRLHPESLIAETCTVICARMDYWPEGAQPLQVLQQPQQAYISRYALGRDYHKVLRRRLVRLAEQIDAAVQEMDVRLRAFTDSAPVLEKALAEKAGLGWMGKHSLLIHPDAGSWFFLGEIYTNLPLPPTPSTQPNRCGACKACINHCPTGAIVGDRMIDARRCISYLTIEHRSAIPVQLRPLMGNRIFGCDDCQLYCPWNRAAPTTAEVDFGPRHGLDAASLLALFRWDEATFLRNTEGMALRRIDFERWRRNLAVALGNGPPSAEAIQALRAARTESSAMVREHIDWALQRLEGCANQTSEALPQDEASTAHERQRNPATP